MCINMRIHNHWRLLFFLGDYIYEHNKYAYTNMKPSIRKQLKKRHKWNPDLKKVWIIKDCYRKLFL